MLILSVAGGAKAYAQQAKVDTIKTQKIKEVVVTADKRKQKVGTIQRTAEQLKVENANGYERLGALYSICRSICFGLKRRYARLRYTWS